MLQPRILLAPTTHVLWLPCVYQDSTNHTMAGVLPSHALPQGNKINVCSAQLQSLSLQILLNVVEEIT